MTVKNGLYEDENSLKKMDYLRLTFCGEAQEKCLLPSYLGSTLRGALGRAFRNNACMAKSNTCSKCMFINQCAYAYIFETSRETVVATKAAVMHAQIPHPLIIEPPEPDQRSYMPGDKLMFSAILIGRAADFYPYIIMAFSEALSIGLGKNQNRFHLIIVTQNFKDEYMIWNGGNQIINRPVKEEISFQMLTESAEKTKILIQTPLRLVNQGQLINELPFEVLMRSIFRRLDLLDKAHGSGKGLNIPYGLYLQKAREVEYLKNESQINWYDWTRYSNRQNTEMQMGGLIGELSYRGDLEIFIPYLKAAEILHVGKGTSFGLGRYKMMISADH